jgi:hypothetical protein
MTTLRLLGTCFSVSACLLAQSAPNRLEGCPDPAKLALGLKALQNRKWVNLSVESVNEIWPSLRGGGSCEPHCILIINDGRVISNEIECGELFHFETSQSTDGSLKTRLESVNIRYSTRTRRGRDAVEWTLIRGLHIGGDAEESYGVATGLGRFRSIAWTDHEPERRSCSLDLQHARFKTKWLLIFGLSCDPDGRPPDVK